MVEGLPGQAHLPQQAAGEGSQLHNSACELRLQEPGQGLGGAGEAAQASDQCPPVDPS